MSDLGDVYVVACKAKNGKVLSYLGDREATFESFGFVGIKRAFLFRSKTAANNAARGMKWTLPEGQTLEAQPCNLAFT